MSLPSRLDELVSLSGRTALVTGGSGGIGRAAVALLADAGARTISVDLPGKDPPPHAAAALECDLADSTAIERLGRTLELEHPRIDALVHAAGITRDHVLWKMTPEEWDVVLAVNLSSAFHLLRVLAPGMRAAGGGSIVLVSSINGERGKLGQANYAASKAGLVALAKTAARELGRFRVRVNCVSPGFVETPMTDAMPEELRRAAVEETVLGRPGRPLDVAAAILFLCSPMSAHVTGQVLRVDGGQWMA